MLRQGNSPKVVQEIAGHHSSAYTMDTYCWSDRVTQRAAADSIGDLFSGALGAMEIKSGDKSGRDYSMMASVKLGAFHARCGTVPP